MVTFIWSLSIKNENNLTIGEGLGLPPTNPDRPGGVARPSPTDSYNIIPTALMS